MSEGMNGTFGKLGENVGISPMEVSFGDYYYVLDDFGNYHLTRVVGFNGKKVALVAAVEGKQDSSYDSMRTVERRLEDLYIVPFDEDWLKANPSVFKSSAFDFLAGKGDDVFTFSSLYRFDSKRIRNNSFDLACVKLNNDEEEKAVFEDAFYSDTGFRFVQVNQNRERKVMLVMINLVCGVDPLEPFAPFACLFSLEQLQHFLVLHGVYDAFNVVPGGKLIIGDKLIISEDEK